MLKKHVFLFGALILFSILLINVVNAGDCGHFWGFDCEECDSDDDCDDDCDDDYYSENYCDNGNVYRDFHDFSCEGRCRHKRCEEDIITELIEDCGEDEYGEWEYYCEGDDVHRIREEIYNTCGNGQCINDVFYNDEFLEWCEYGCEDGECINEPEPPEPVCGDGIEEGDEECDDGNNDDGDGCSSVCILEYCGDDIINNIDEMCEFNEDCGQGYYCDSCMCYEEPEPPEPECCDDEDCDEDYYENTYCSSGDVYKDLYDFFCEDGICLFNIIPELVEECDSDEDCEDGECVEEDDDNGSCNNRELYNNCRLNNVEDILVIYDPLENEVKVIDNKISLINKSQEKIIDNSWILYLFIGCVGLIVLILIVLSVKR